MRHHRALSSWVAVSLVALATFSVEAARADDSTCQADSDCGKGFSCQVTGGSTCGSAGCAPGEACDAAPPCEPTVSKSCVAANCTTDSDCADGMVCYQSAVACPAIACPKGQDCPPIACEPGPKQCTPRYELSCTQDADCGAGFTCAFGEECSGTTTAADAGTPATPSNPGTAGSANLPPDTTTCMPSTIGSCHVTPVACKTNTDCKAGWSCLDVNAGYGCAEGSSPPAAQGTGGAGSNADGGSPAPSAGAGAPTPSAGASSIGTGCPPPPAPMLLCTPPGYGYGYDGSLGSGSPTSSASGGAASAGVSTPTTPERGATNDASGTTDPKTSTSCSVSIPGGSSNSGFALIALGLFGFIRRRRVSARLSG